MDSLDALQRHLDKIMKEQNNRQMPDFEGYSPLEMGCILYNTFGENSPIQFLKLEKIDYAKIPILNQIKYLLKIIENVGELKLTAKGFLPTKVVKDIYKQKFIKEKLIELGISKLYKEADAISINMTRIISEISGLIKKRNNKLTLTKKGKKELNNDHRMLKSIFTTFVAKFNWAYYDRFVDTQIGQFGFGFSLILISKYGAEKRLDSFYAAKYLSAFPALLQGVEHSKFDSIEGSATRCYSLRTFDRFLDYFGLIEIYVDRFGLTDKFIKKTDLYDKLIKIRPHLSILGN